MSDEYDDNIVDLDAFRKQREEEEAEKERLKREQQDLEEIEYMRHLLGSIMQNLGDPTKTGTLFYVPMSDDDYNNYYAFESGYNDEGYYESTWEWDGSRSDDFYYDILNKNDLDDEEEDI